MKILLFVLVVLAGALAGKPIVNLPGYNGPKLTMSSGYVTVDQSHGRNIFYWLVESTSDHPERDPLVFWYQGGPGCSGLGGGLFTEIGPFVPDGNGGLKQSSYPWSSIANVVYLEQPAGVGFSYSNTPSDYNTDDTKSAIDNFAFLEGFLTQNPKFIGRDTWLAGESYAGVYIPSLTRQILNHIDSISYRQLRGFLVGNPVFDCNSLDYDAMQIDMFYWHGLVSWTNYGNWTAYGCKEDSTRPGCDYIADAIVSGIGIIDQELKLKSNSKRKVRDDIQPSLDPDDLYQDFCTGNGTLEFVNSNPDSCNALGDQVAKYLNRPDVQKAINAKPTTWSECTDNINYNTSDASMIPLYASFFKDRPDLDLLVFSGDVDIATVPFGATLPCLAELRGLVKPVSVWQPWFVNEWTAGYVEQYDRYSFATLKGAGHEAPAYQPHSAFEMFKRWITRQNLSENATVPRKKKLNLSRLTQGKMLRKHGVGWKMPGSK